MYIQNIISTISIPCIYAASVIHRDKDHIKAALEFEMDVAW